MTPERWRRVEELYHAALTRAGDERAAFLTAACAGDQALQREVELLLAQAVSARGFLDGPAVAVAGHLASDSSAPVSSGQRFGPYQVNERIGIGGMGEVYRARDTKLRRDVALKILPGLFTRDPERLARFEREARVLASLNHPHIGAIYGLEDEDGVRALVLELVEGDTLAERIARGPLPLHDALAIARQIAEALEAAHERGIIHRDLKPANVKVRPDGTVKVLDFGLAKAAAGDGAAPDLTQSPTVTVGGTQEGVVLGTAAYMSPEQARGKTVDKRTDIWAFGCVLYELLTGRSAFAGETLSDTIAAVLEREPHWHALPHATSAAVRRLLQRCLEKDPRQRLRDIGDARIEIADELEAPVPNSRLIPVRGISRREQAAWTLAILGAFASVLLATRALSREESGGPTEQVVRSAIVLPPTQSLELQSGSLFAISPDGTRLVYSASREGRVGLYVRTIHQFQTEPLEGTDGGTHPFFSPDGRWVGFFANGALRRTPIDGGAPTVIVNTPVGHGAGWAADNTIVFARPGSGLMRVSADGGAPQPITTLSAERGETGHDWPQILPGGQGVLFTIVIGNDNGVGFGVVPLQGGATRIVAARHELNADSATLLPPGDLVQARYAASGHVVYGQIGAVWGLPFDLARLEARGSPIELLDNVFEGPGSGAIYFGVTGQGALLYVPAGTSRSLVRVDRRGRASPISSTGGAFRLLRLSPDGQQVAVCIDVRGGPTSIWAFDVQRGTATRVTSVGHNLLPVWTPDSTRIAYARSGQLHIQTVDGGGTGESILSRPVGQEPYSWTPDGQTLLFSERQLETQWDLWAVTLPERAATPVLVTSDNERLPVVSPDGRRLAYISDESGRYEVYVRGFRQPGARVQVSIEVGTEPAWSRDGRELFFRRDNEYYTVPVTTAETFEAGRPQFLFAYGLPFVSSNIASYDVTPDGQYFVMIASDPESAPTHFRLVTNWVRELSARVASTATP